MFSTALTGPQPDWNVDGRVGMKRICEEIVFDCTTLFSPKRDINIHDCTLDADLYCQYIVVNDEVDSVL